MLKSKKKQKKINPIAKDLRTSKYKMRVVKNKKVYSRKKKKFSKKLKNTV
tara:strand:- start:2180 stop:2329 length:150 start_codon:yes stop_codon:yes gene_type:complete